MADASARVGRRQVQHSKRGGRQISLLALIVLLSACGLNPKASYEAEPVRLVSLQEQGQEAAARNHLPAPAMIQDLAAARLQIESYPPAGLRKQLWYQRLQDIENTAFAGQAEQAAGDLQALRQELSDSLEDYYFRHAERYLQQAQQYAFLNDAQRDQRRRLEFHFARGEYAKAYGEGQSLVRALWGGRKQALVRPGDTLARIAARTEVYDNFRLWPLLWEANKGLLHRNPPLQPAWRLYYWAHPSLEEIFAAVDKSSP